MKSKCFLQVLLFFVFLSSVSLAKTEVISPDEAMDFAQKQGQTLIRTFSEPDIGKKYAALDSLFLEYIDLQYISRFVIGKYWKEMTPEQQAQYQSLFSRYARNVYKGFPLTFDENTLRYVLSGSRVEGKDTFVSANVEYTSPQGEVMKFFVEFRMHKVAGQIKITDIKMAESSLILSYRNRFYQMVKSSGGEVEWFLEDFEDSTRAAEKAYSLP